MPDGLYLRPRFLPAGDAALTIELGGASGAELNERVLAFDAAVRAAAIPGIVETVPTYHSLVVHYDPTALGAAELRARLEGLEIDPAAGRTAARLWRIPVAYGGAYGMDLEHIAERHGLTPERVVALHGAAEYRASTIGFAPGLHFLVGRGQPAPP